MNIAKFYPVGSKVKIKDATVLVFEIGLHKPKCDKCYFQRACRFEDLELIPLVPQCLQEEREDLKEVYFELIKE